MFGWDNFWRWFLIGLLIGTSIAVLLAGLSGEALRYIVRKVRK